MNLPGDGAILRDGPPAETVTPANVAELYDLERCAEYRHTTMTPLIAP